MIITSLALYAYTRRNHSSKRILDLGLAYMIADAFGTGVMFHVGTVFFRDHLPNVKVAVAPEISWIGVVILMFAAIVPSSPRKTIIASLIAVSMNPVGMLIARAYGAWDFRVVEQRVAHALPGLPARRRRRRHLARRDAARSSGDEGARDGQLPTRRAARSGRHGRGLSGDAHDAGARGSDQADPPGDVRRAEQRWRAARAQALRPRGRGSGDLRSPHTVEVYDFGVTEDQTLYFVMEMLDGMDLESLVGQYGALPAGRVIYLIRQVCESLEEAHERGLVHRDIKPANIHVGIVGLRHDFVKVLDFGLVKEVKSPEAGSSHLTADGLAVGTPAYMAPELALNETVDGRADVYALGCVAYYLLTGRMVFESDNTMRLLVKHIEEKPLPPSSRTERPIPTSLDDAILGCLAKDPSARTPSAAAFAEALTMAESDVEPWGETQASVWWREHASPDSASRDRLTTPIFTPVGS